MEELLKQLNQINNESELFEQLLAETLADKPTAKITAAKIQAGRDIRFDLKKIIKQLNT